MKTHKPDEMPTYLVGEDGKIHLNAPGQALLKRYQDMKVLYDALDASWGAAVLAALFVSHPWLDALTITVETSWEYDDAGSFFKSSSCRVDEVSFAPSGEHPQEIVIDGEPDESLAAGWVSDVLDEEGPGFALSLIDDDSSERTLTITRAALTPVLGNRPISGSAAHAVLMPFIGS